MTKTSYMSYNLMTHHGRFAIYPLGPLKQGNMFFLIEFLTKYVSIYIFILLFFLPCQCISPRRKTKQNYINKEIYQRKLKL